MNEKDLDQILDEMQQQAPDPAALAAAQERVWAKLAAPAVCAEFRADYGRPNLRQARQQLLEDHLARCVECRRRLTPGPQPIALSPRPVRRFSVPKWVIAAGLAAIGLFAGRHRIDSLLAPAGPRATLESLSGPAYTLAGEPLAIGATLGEAQLLRTGRDARATLRLADGSTVEVNESSALAVRAAWSGQSIDLERGDIIVHAAKQRRGGLRVLTRDSVATVRGTIFTVSTGTAGSLVGVIEGSVGVNQPNAQTLLQPGERAASTATLERVSVKDAVAWSPRAPEYFTLLSELSRIEKQLTPVAERTEARLLAALPRGTVVYGALPNAGPTVNEAIALIEQRSQENAALKSWWQSAEATEIKQIVHRIRTLSPLLGEELVFALTQEQLPVVLATVAPGRQAAVQAALAPLGPVASAFTGGLLVISDSPAHLAQLLPRLGGGASTPFAREIARHYQRGVVSLFGVDLEAMTPREPTSGMRYLLFHQRASDTELALSFSGPRTGLAAWLAAPAAAASAEYVSADALFALSANTGNPRQMLDELIARLGLRSPGFADALSQSEAADLAAALGTDFTFALETPSLPVPGWILAIEAYRPELYADAIRRLATTFTLHEEQANGRTWYALRAPGQPFQFHWTFDRGYLVHGSDRATIQRALATRASGFPLVRSAPFRQQLPAGSALHYSGFVWANPGAALSSLAALAPDPAWQQLLTNPEPALLTLTGEAEQIRFGSRTRLSSLLAGLLVSQPANPAQRPGKQP